MKSNAYGHGINEVSKILETIDVEYFIVQNYFEAKEIWETKNQKVLMLGTETFGTYLDIDFSLLTPVVGSIKLLEHLVSTQTEMRIHLKINTGMNRQGIDPSELDGFLSILEKNEQIQLEGVLTHFSDADGPENGFTYKQYDCFTACIKKITDSGVSPKWIHTSNSAGLSKTVPGLITAARAGIALYGLNPLEEADENYDAYQQLLPVLSLHSFLTHVRTIKPGEYVGYGNTYEAQKETRVGTIPVGYYEGIPRLMSNVGSYSTTTGIKLPILGRVSMNLTTVDITDKDLVIGDEIVVYGTASGFPNTIIKNADLCGTISYELTTNLKPHLPRKIV